MQSVLISLADRADRRDAFFARNDGKLGCSPSIQTAVDGRTYELKKPEAIDPDWRDPILKRPLTKGEVGCLLSHLEAWKHAVDCGEPLLVLEDDAVVTNLTNVDLCSALAKIDPADYDLLYLAHNEMLEDGVRTDNNGLTIPCYPYWTLGYVITPAAAQILLDAHIETAMIPVDEFLPRMSDRLRLRATPKAWLEPMGRHNYASDVEPKSAADYANNSRLHLYTVGSDSSKMHWLERSAEAYGLEIANLFNVDQMDWNGGLDAKQCTGGGIKLRLLSQQLHSLDDSDIVLFTDAYDVVYCATEEEIVRRYLAMKEEIVFAAERYLWPDRKLRFPPSATPYRYLNSGTFIGRVRALKQLLLDLPEDNASDQLFLQKKFLTGRYPIRLDTEQYIFSTHDPKREIKNGLPFHPDSRCSAVIMHGNGGEEAKQQFERQCRELLPEKSYAIARSYKEIGPEMLLIDYKTPEQCQRWIELAEEHGGFQPHPADKFPSHDIHLKKLGLMAEAEAHWREVVKPIIESYWRPMHYEQLRKAFVMKYSADTQTTLGLHNDSAMVTGSVKLNDDYSGAILHWPRQKVNNAEIPVGKMILFPSMVTHGHYVDQLRSGTKYSATFWSARFPGEELD